MTLSYAERERIIETKAHDITLQCDVIFYNEKKDKVSHYELVILNCDALLKRTQFDTIAELFDAHSRFIKSDYAELARVDYNDESIIDYI
jgi:hypothetical protein